ncbi:hypothetical protein LIER_33476 [Lithospermum erythrorhizon]|uniref:DUF4218 domain-containing protein n=1 Tax=Lithospermum erythrorhizon TaxID=34254 RepID=A0AAV3RYK5_LITER
MLVDGPKGSGNKIDVYMQPLIEELKELWVDGIMTYDASINQMFSLHAALLWTMSDFPAYVMLSEKIKKCELACPHCGKNTRSHWLKYGRKYCYTYHRRFLPTGHKLRRDKVSFNEKIELERNPPILSGIEIKDNLNSRRDLEHLGIRTPLHPKRNRNGKLILPPGPFSLGKAEKNLFCKVLKNLKALDRYGSNISRCVHENESTLLGLKSHDLHSLMQQILPVIVRKILPASVVKVLIEISNFFKQLCSKVNTISDLEKIQERIVLTICHLEKIFPPSFFDTMEHLPIHLVGEALMVGPV